MAVAKKDEKPNDAPKEAVKKEEKPKEAKVQPEVNNAKSVPVPENKPQEQAPPIQLKAKIVSKKVVPPNAQALGPLD